MNSNVSNGINGTESLQQIEINIFFVVLLPILIIVTSILNLATIVAFWKLPSLREKPSDLLILNLSCADLITGMVLFPISAPLHMTPNYWPTGEIGCVVAICFLNICIHGSLFALTTISIERFMLVYMEYPQYTKTVTRQRIYKVIAAGWIFVFCTVVIEVGLWNKTKDIDDSAAEINFNEVCLSPARRIESYSLTIFLVLYLFPVMLVCGLSLAFLYQLRKRLEKNTPGTDVMSEDQLKARSASQMSLDKLDMLEESELATSSSLKKESKDRKVGKLSLGLLKTISTSFLHHEQSQACSASQVSLSMLKIPSSHSLTDNEEYKTTSFVSSISKADNKEKCTESGKRRNINRKLQLRNRYIKPGITLGALVTAMAICMLPYCFYVIVTESGCEQCNNTVVLYDLLLLQFCNATIDPFIYVFTRKKIRQFYSRMYHKCKSSRNT